MAIEVKDPNYELGEKATYVTVNGVKYAVVRADAWFDQIGSGNAPAPCGKSLSVPLGDVIKGSGKFYGVKTVKLALNPVHPAYHAAVHRATYYPADQVTFTAVSRKKLRPSLTFRTSRTQFGANFVASLAGEKRLQGRRVAREVAAANQ